MAQTIPCDICEAEPAVLLIQNLNAAEVSGLGANCAVTGLRAMADTIEAAQTPPPAEEPTAEADTVESAPPGEDSPPAPAGSTPEPAVPDESVDLDAPVDFVPADPAPATAP